MHYKYLARILAAVIILFLIFSLSCSTKKNTFTRRVYHNLTAHYNAYFNGKEALKEGTIELGKISKDDFTKILPVFQLGTKTDAQSVYNYLDRSLEKGSIVVQRHSIFIKGKEYIRWIDDAYLLIGQSYFYKQEYDLAMQTCNYILNRFKKSDLKNEVIILKSLINVQQDRLDEAEALLVSIENKFEKKKSTRTAEKLYPMALSNVLLKQERYEQAIENLNASIKLNKKKRIRTRLHFILAQAYQRTGQLPKSNENFKKVIRLNPIYDMEFAAKMNLAQNYDVTSGDSKDIKKLLSKMLRDDKNKEYLDQIYYVIADINLKENDMESAVENLKKSARLSVSNNKQKARSYLKLADLYFAEPLYKPAQVYYDSCVQFLPKDYPNYILIENKKNTLNELVKNINAVDLQDSLQKLARMPVGERNKKIDEVIEQIRKDEERKRQEEMERQQNLALAMQNQNNMQTTGSWYFYNPTSMNFGYTEFVRKWGKRPYEDLWRLSDKTVTEIQFQDITEESDSTDNKKDSTKINLKDRNYYISQLPLTPEAIEKSNLDIAEALYNIGYIYKESLLDNDKSVEAFNKLEKRYPESIHLLPAFYNLFQIYISTDNTPKADYYKNLILTKYPDSDYAKIIQDPEYYVKLEEKQNRYEKYYKETYMLYQEGNYNIVINNADSVIKTLKDKKLVPKFELLKALAIGKTQPTETFEKTLKDIVSKYGGTEPAGKAQEYLDALSRIKNMSSGENVNITDTVKTETKEIYKFDPGAFHFYIAVLEMKNTSINEVKIAYSDFNMKFFSTQKYTINTLFLDDKHEVLNVARFNNKNEALDYLNAVQNNQGLVKILENASYRHFVISAANYPLFYQNKDVDKYLKFFNKYYKIQQK